MSRRLYLAFVFFSMTLCLSLVSTPVYSNGLKVIQFSSEIMRVLRGFRNLPRMSDHAVATARLEERFPSLVEELHEIRWLCRYGSQSKNGMQALEKLSPGGLRLLELERHSEGQRLTRELYRVFDDVWDQYYHSEEQIAEVSANFERLARQLYKARFEETLGQAVSEARLKASPLKEIGIGHKEFAAMARERTPSPNELLEEKLFSSPEFYRRSTLEGRRVLEEALAAGDSATRQSLLHSLDSRTLRALDEVLFPKKFNGSLDGIQISPFLTGDEVYAEAYEADLVSDLRLLDFLDRAIFWMRQEGYMAVKGSDLVPTSRVVSEFNMGGSGKIGLEELKNLTATVEDHLWEPAVRERHRVLNRHLFASTLRRTLAENPLSRTSPRIEAQISSDLDRRFYQLESYLDDLKTLLDEY